MYCTYITFYRGNLLPPFYIGYTTTKNISRGYNGSVASKKYKSVWRQERKERPHLFQTVIYRTFNTREEALEHEEHVLRVLQAHKNDLYINRHVGGKFTPGPRGPRKPHSGEAKKKMGEAAKRKWQDPEQRRLVSVRHTGKIVSAYTREKLSVAAKARAAAVGGTFRGKTHTEEAKERMRIAALGRARKQTTRR